MPSLEPTLAGGAGAAALELLLVEEAARLLRSTAAFFSGAVDEEAAAALAAELLAVVGAELRTALALVVLGLVASGESMKSGVISNSAHLRGAESA